MAMIRKPEPPKHIAEDFYIGNTHVQICTDYCCKPEEVPAILQRIARWALTEYAAAAAVRP
jgi:hypothetical protein